MKKTQFVITILVFSCSIIAQVQNLKDVEHFKQFDWEIVTSLSTGMGKTTFKSNSGYGYYNESGENEFYSESLLSIGFFIVDGLSIEPELAFRFLGETTMSLVANTSYTFTISGKNIHPFLTVGYGKTSFNGIGNNYYDEDSEGLFGSLKANLINACIGIKIQQSLTFAYRLELNYKNISHTESYNNPYSDPYKVTLTTSVLAVKFGTSFLL